MDNLDLIASEVCDAITSDDWEMPPRTGLFMRIGGNKRLEYVNISMLLNANELDEWAYWEDGYDGYRKDLNRPSPHISREFDKQGTG